MRYADDMARLARATATLVVTGPALTTAVYGAEQQAVLTARDAVVTELRGLCRALLRAAPDEVRPDLLVTSPAHALHAALADLPLAASRDTALTDALAVPGGPLTRAWQDTARAAVALERYHDVLASGLDGPDAWGVASDVGELVSALPLLDDDLAAALPPGSDRALAALLEPATHGLARLAADELSAHTRDLPAGASDVGLPLRPLVRPVRTLADLPPATAHLGALIARRGAGLTVTEARGASRALMAGVTITSQALASSGANNAAAGTATQQLLAALPHLEQVVRGRVATLTPPSPAVLHLSQQIRERIAAVGRTDPHVERGGRAVGTATGLLGAVQPLSLWAGEAAGVAGAVRDGLQAAAAAGKLFAPRQDAARGRDQQFLWLPTTRGSEGPPPVLDAATRSAAALTAAADPLTELSGSPVGAARANAATRRAATDASSAFADLRAALHTRPQQRLPNVARPAHPALPPDPSSRRARPSR